MHTRPVTMRLVLAFTLFFSFAVQAQEPPAWFTESFLDVREDVAEATKEGKRLMLYFGQDGCPYCKQLMEVNFKDPKIVGKTRQNFVAIALNIWGDREVTWTDGKTYSEKDFARLLKIQFTPSLLFLDEKGAVALRLNGYLPPERFGRALDYAAGRMETKLPFGEYMNSPGASAPASPASGKKKDLGRKAGGKPLAVLFVGPQCETCAQLEREGLKRPEVRAQLAKLDLIRLDLAEKASLVTPSGTAATADEWARSLQLGYLPTLVFFDASGQEVFRTEAYVRTFHLAGSFEYVASGAYTREPSFQRFLQDKSERMRERGARVDLWK